MWSILPCGRIFGARLACLWRRFLAETSRCGSLGCLSPQSGHRTLLDGPKLKTALVYKSCVPVLLRGHDLEKNIIKNQRHQRPHHP